MMSGNFNIRKRSAMMTRNNSQENEWNSFDQSMDRILGGALAPVDTSSRPRTSASLGLAPSPSSLHSDIMPQQVTNDVTRGSSQSQMPSYPPMATGQPLAQEQESSLKEDAMFSCAACGQRKSSYTEISKHVQDDHVGDDMELVLASILLPDQGLLREYQCGVKSCGHKILGGSDQELRDHIRTAHGEFYINICSGRNLVRMCRICDGKFGSDSLLTDHIANWHPIDMFATKTEPGPDEVEPKMEEVKVKEEYVPEIPKQIPSKVHSKEREGRAEYRKSRTSESSSVTSVRMSVAHMDLEKPRKRKLSESIKERLTMISQAPPEAKKAKASLSRDSNDNLLEETDLKYRLLKIRADKIKTKAVFCEACARTTKDWSNHRFSLEHMQNDKKLRCHFCPKRFWNSELKSHISKEHKGCSFTCNVTSSCRVRLMALDKLTTHINEKHRDQVDQLIRQFGHAWQSNYVSSTHLGMNNFFLLPSDLRKLSCRVCGLWHLSQDQSALEKHFREEHPNLPPSAYNSNIIFECRVCSGMLFGSETHLLRHFQDCHLNAGLSIDLDSEPEAKSKIKKAKLRKEADKEKVKSQEVSSSSNSIIKRSRPRSSVKKINTFSSSKVHSSSSSSISRRHHQKLYSDLVSSDESSDASQSVVTCHFCETKMQRFNLKKHMMKNHKANLFFCGGSCGSELYSEWRSDIVTHLRLVHKLKASDSKMNEIMTLPLNLGRIYCKKAAECEDEAIFLAREVDSVQIQKMMKRHAEKRHRGLKIDECYNLGCRICPQEWRLDEVKAWENHCRKHQGLPESLSSDEPDDVDILVKKLSKRKNLYKLREKLCEALKEFPPSPDIQPAPSPEPEPEKSAKSSKSSKQESKSNGSTVACSLCESKIEFEDIQVAIAHLESMHFFNLVSENLVPAENCAVMTQLGDRLIWPSKEHSTILQCVSCENKVLGNDVKKFKHSNAECKGKLINKCRFCGISLNEENLSVHFKEMK